MTPKQKRARERNFFLHITAAIKGQLNYIHQTESATSKEKVLIHGLIRKINIFDEEIRRANGSHTEDTND